MGDGETGVAELGAEVGPGGAGERVAGGGLAVAPSRASASKSTRPVASSTLMWSRTVVLASSASSRTSALRVEARTWATSEKTCPWARRRMLANFCS